VDNVVGFGFYEFVGSEGVYMTMTLFYGLRRSKNGICVPSDICTLIFLNFEDVVYFG
jgi:hypothetical protein